VIDRPRWILAGFAVAFVVALCFDGPIARQVHDSGLSLALKTHYFAILWLVRRLGYFPSFTLVVSVLLFMLGKAWHKPAMFVFLSGVLSGGNFLLKWAVGRQRPFTGTGVYQLRPFASDGHLFGTNLSFPSGDVCLASATLFSLAMLFPRRQLFVLPFILLIALERIAEGAHYPSDTVAGMALGWGCALLSWQLLGRPTAPCATSAAEGEHPVESPPGVGTNFALDHHA